MDTDMAAEGLGMRQHCLLSVDGRFVVRWCMVYSGVDIGQYIYYYKDCRNTC
jgi:hypothetical protein